MSATKILAQGVPLHITSIPGVNRTPVLVHLRAQITDGAGTALVIADNDATVGYAGTTPGLTLVRSGAGIYDLNFGDGFRSYALGTLTVAVIPAVLATVAQWRAAAVDITAANTSAKTGKLRFATLRETDATIQDPVSGSEIHLSILADMG